MIFTETSSKCLHHRPRAQGQRGLLRSRSARTDSATYGAAIIAQANIANLRKHAAACTSVPRRQRPSWSVHPGRHSRHHRRPASGKPNLPRSHRRRAQPGNMAALYVPGALRTAIRRCGGTDELPGRQFCARNAEGGARYDDAAECTAAAGVMSRRRIRPSVRSVKSRATEAPDVAFIGGRVATEREAQEHHMWIVDSRLKFRNSTSAHQGRSRGGRLHVPGLTNLSSTACLACVS